MLDSDTKKHLDAARDILVGKVPDPKAQVDQITTALTYKFMDDMDRESEELGGKARFLTGDFEKYRWNRLLDTKLSGEERLNLYFDAITKMSSNNNLQELFRYFFKEANLPYRDPETLSLFLKEINYFNYDHSEVLGNAFEYLLSILGSQGDAGQFRTPRHIIDFMVKVVDPNKNDKILDPACGTAGFLISSYKHIIMNNSSSFTNKIGLKTKVENHGQHEAKKLYSGDLLGPDAKNALAQNIVGYDISPDMVKLALVNMFLHDFASPKIYEYDTLTSDDNWRDSFSVILANPPFMTPKGGIRPHNKFSIKANRAEILFVDYILEHLQINGRAGIIVPEGIIVNNNNNSYVALRKMLVDNGLFAVASLPSGVFQPYSGVKTSILFIDKKLAKERKDILFMTITNDGFDLGSQRRKIDKNDLPEALQILNHWKEGKKKKSSHAHWVSKKRIFEQDDCTLNGELYFIKRNKKPNQGSLVNLGSFLDVVFGERITKRKDLGTQYPVYGGGGNSFRTDDFNREDEYVIARFAMSLNCVRYVKNKFWLMDSGGTFKIKDSYKEKIVKAYVGIVLLSKQDDIFNCSRGAAQRNLDINQFYKIQIPIPLLEVQKKIVKEIELNNNIIEASQKMIEIKQQEIAEIIESV